MSVFQRLGAVALLITLAAPAAAQTTASASINAVVDVIGIVPIAATGVNDLNFGTVLAGEVGTITNVAADAGRWEVTGDPNNPVTVEFALPTDLSGPGGTVPIAFGSNDGLRWGPFPTSFTTFDPNVVFTTALNALGELVIGIRGVVSPPVGLSTGTYTGTITMTVSYL